MDGHPTGAHRRTRSFALLAGAQATSVPGEPITKESLVMAAVPAETVGRLPEEWQQVLRLCQAPNARLVAELAARMQMYITPMTLMLTELLAHGLITHRSPHEDDRSNIALLRKVVNGLQKL